MTPRAKTFFQKTFDARGKRVRLAATGLFAFAVLAAYLALSLFEAWAFVPFWLQDLALIGAILALYLFAKKALKQGKKAWHPNFGIILGLIAFAAVAGVGLGVGFQHAGQAAKGRIVQGFLLSLRQPPASAQLTLTAVPPRYLDQPKQTLFSDKNGPVKRFAASDLLTLPEGTLLKIAVHDTKDFTPTIFFQGHAIKTAAADKGRFTAEVPLVDDGKLEIRVGPYVSFSQGFQVLPDHEPILAFVENPALTKRDSLRIHVAFEDDHGLENLALEISRRDLTSLKTETIPLPVTGMRPGATDGVLFVNLLSHRWAGTAVEATVVGFDSLGQQGRTKTVSLRLPQKDFTNPAAGVLISVRSALINNPERKNAQVRRLETLTQDTSLFEGRLGLYAALRATFWKLRSAETETDIDQVCRLLWQTALAIEDDGTGEQQTVIGLFEELGTILSKGKNADDFETLSKRLETSLKFLFDRELGLFSTRTGMRDGVEGADVPALETFQSLIARMRSLHSEGRDKDALMLLLQLQGYFEAFALNPDTPSQS